MLVKLGTDAICGFRFASGHVGIVEGIVFMSGYTEGEKIGAGAEVVPPPARLM